MSTNNNLNLGADCVNGIGERIKALRLQNGLTQKELAQALVLSISCIAMYETDKRKPSLEVLVVLARYFGVSADFLLGC